MVRNALHPSPVQPLCASISLTISVGNCGSVTGLLGRMDMTTRRYTFVRLDLPPVDPSIGKGIRQAIFAAVSALGTDEEVRALLR